MSSADRWRAWLPVPFLPRLCPVCGGDADAEEIICGECRTRLDYFRILAPFCEGCGLPLGADEEALCYRCAGRSERFCRGKALFLYRDTVRTLLRRYKFDGLSEPAALMTAEFAAALPYGNGCAIVPIPSSRASRRRRGWGHMERIGSLLSSRGFRVTPRLLRRRATQQQKFLDPARRRENMADAFRVRGNIAGKDLILLDDLRTTGATLDAAAAALLRAGAERVRWISFAID